ncbi:NERD domain-containing protein [[Brevibacterium] frigoritolerans]|nr:NERD domain-containing protein [Peribacillus frigoritolerans]
MLSVLLVSLLLVLFLYVKISRVKKKPTDGEIKGLIGEQKVNDILKEQKVLYFHDTLLKNGPASTQIDHICVFPNKTILVIETKNKDGVMSGTSFDEKWVQVLGKNRYEFYNPIKQNEGHIKFIHKKMNQHRLYGYKMLSLVVFTSNKSTLIDPPSGVIHIDQLPSVIKRLNKKTLFNRSKKFSRMLRKEDFSGNKREVHKHKDFAKRARYY